MTITIVYDNEVYQEGLKSDWGFSCVIEKENNPKILFDTGANGSILLSNLEKLEIEPTSIDEIFISHNHFDHIGGLSSFLNVHNKVRVYVPVSLRGVRSAKEIVYVDEPLKIHQDFFSTGELEGIEQSLVIKGEEGLDLVCPTHCTQFKEKIKELYPEKYIPGGVGKIISI